MVGGGTKSTDPAATIKFARKFEQVWKREFPIGSNGVSIHIPAETPVFSAVIASNASFAAFIRFAASPQQPCGISRLSRYFSCLRQSLRLCDRRFAGQWVEDACLNAERISFGD